MNTNLIAVVLSFGDLPDLHRGAVYSHDDLPPLFDVIVEGLTESINEATPAALHSEDGWEMIVALDSISNAELKDQYKLLSERDFMDDAAIQEGLVVLAEVLAAHRSRNAKSPTAEIITPTTAELVGQLGTAISAEIDAGKLHVSRQIYDDERMVNDVMEDALADGILQDSVLLVGGFVIARCKEDMDYLFNAWANADEDLHLDDDEDEDEDE